MSIISMLMGILLPSLNRARQQAKSILCLSNLRQMTTAAEIYTTSNDSFYPIAYFSKRISNIRSDYAWDFTHFTDWSTTPAKKTVQPGYLWSGPTNLEIQQCPCFEGEDNWLDDPFTGYNYNTSYLGRNETKMDPQTYFVPSAKNLEVTHPAKTAIFGDAMIIGGGANKCMRAPLSNPRDAGFSDPGRIAGAQGYIHLGKTNVAFCDGHAQSWQKLYTNSSAGSQLETYNKTTKQKIGFISEDNSLYDLK